MSLAPYLGVPIRHERLNVIPFLWSVVIGAWGEPPMVESKAGARWDGGSPHSTHTVVNTVRGFYHFPFSKLRSSMFICVPFSLKGAAP